MLRFPNSSEASEGGLYFVIRSVTGAKAMFYVYILRSETHPNETYIGSTGDLRRRLAEHNAGKSIHTNKFKPWALKAYFALPEKDVAENFERYLKSGSGRAFSKRHLLTTNGQNS